MIEMSFDKETVLSCEGQTDPTSQQYSELTRNDTSVPHLSGNSTVINLSKETGEEAGSETSLEHREKTASPDNNTPSDRGVVGVESSTETQNGTQQPKPQQQKVNKRRSTMSAGFKHPGYGKRRRRANSESESVLPTNFLLGGNIFDPLNLNSLLDEEVNRALNAETPKSSPLPAKSRDPVEILIPRDITDPLNLNCPSAGDSSLLVSPLKSGRRRHRNKHHGASTGRVSGEGIVTQMDLPESNGCAAGQDEGTTTVSLTHSHSGAVANKLVPEDQPLLDSNLEAQCSNKPNLATNGSEVKEKTIDISTAPSSTNPTNPPSSRQRKRRRAGNKLENADSSNSMRNWGPRSGRHFQPSHTPGMGSHSGAAQRPQQHQNHWRSQSNSNQIPQQTKKKFQYGNYNKYYGYRNPGLSEDPRIRVMDPEWFRGKEVLDLGCNTGHLTLSVAKNCRPARIVGLDIDAALIHAAWQNIRHYLSEVRTQQARRSGENGEGNRGEGKERIEGDLVEEKSQRKEKDGESFVVKEERDENKTKHVDKANECMVEKGMEVDREERENKTTEADQRERSWKMEEEPSAGLPDGKRSFPVSLRISRGPIAGPPLPEMITNSLPPGDFPANVTFVKGNYVLESDMLLQTQTEEYDVILCLSVTKWVHLNWGDAGLKRLFKRVYKHLRPGGLFILEPQPWNSYGKRKKLTETIFKNYHSIRLKPDHFSSYLTTEVGFSSYELIGTSQNYSRGFQRPIYLFHKGPSPQK
ncbi:7SK snRNA methylphosphate capping enzyme [Carassius auratus]|uniref:RNA methyltransferase n=1 Tax=Carassius auratus TaxID=7957 RepID=A0A6P6P4R1_CARAU|nr:7SK snRNA methylphosphate capping enzyme-like [Carassius auratus]XP_026115715.1 7SK snRNA methylphosphate capping enzyme-like [Carassius auratus]